MIVEGHGQTAGISRWLDSYHHTARPNPCGRYKILSARKTDRYRQNSAQPNLPRKNEVKTARAEVLEQHIDLENLASLVRTTDFGREGFVESRFTSSLCPLVLTLSAAWRIRFLGVQGKLPLKCSHRMI